MTTTVSDLQAWDDQLVELLKSIDRLPALIERDIPAGGSPAERLHALNELLARLGVRQDALDPVQHASRQLQPKIRLALERTDAAYYRVVMFLAREVDHLLSTGDEDPAHAVLVTAGLTGFYYGVNNGASGRAGSIAALLLRLTPPDHPARTLLPPDDLHMGSDGLELVVGPAVETLGGLPLRPWYPVALVRRFTTNWRATQKADEQRQRELAAAAERRQLGEWQQRYREYLEHKRSMAQPPSV